MSGVKANGDTSISPAAKPTFTGVPGKAQNVRAYPYPAPVADGLAGLQVAASL
jgi:hypothetical protein